MGAAFWTPVLLAVSVYRWFIPEWSGFSVRLFPDESGRCRITGQWFIPRRAGVAAFTGGSDFQRFIPGKSGFVADDFRSSRISFCVAKLFTFSYLR